VQGRTAGGLGEQGGGLLAAEPGRSTIFMRSACPACSVQQIVQAGGVHSVGVTATPTPAVGRRLRGAVGGRGSA